MNEQDILKVREIAASTFEVPIEQITLELTIGSIPQWDSLGHLGLVSALEEGFGITFDVDELFEVESLADLVRLLENELK